MLKNIVIVLCGIAAFAMPNTLAFATTKPTAFDVAELLIKGAQPNEILAAAIESNIRVAPEYLGVKFYDTSTDKALDDNEIRALMGPVRQNGAYQALQLALSMTNNELALNQEQLTTLLDAAFIASMRRPPEHISVEFYDVRVGPSGQGGGPSGSVPDSVNAIEAAEPESHKKVSKSRESRLNSDIMRRVIPSDESALLAIFEQLDIRVERRAGYAVFPIVVAAETKADLPELLAKQRESYERYFNITYASSIDTFLHEPFEGIYRYIEVAYFSGDPEILNTLEQDMNNVFYHSP